MTKTVTAVVVVPRSSRVFLTNQPLIIDFGRSRCLAQQNAVAARVSDKYMFRSFVFLFLSQQVYWPHQTTPATTPIILSGHTRSKWRRDCLLFYNSLLLTSSPIPAVIVNVTTWRSRTEMAQHCWRKRAAGPRRVSSTEAGGPRPCQPPSEAGATWSRSTSRLMAKLQSLVGASHGVHCSDTRCHR